MEPAIHVERVSKTFARSPALRSVGFSVADGEMVALLGASGSGKSTLIRILAGLTPSDPGSGPVTVLGRPLQSGGRISADIRSLRAHVGVVFQQFNLVGQLPVLHNVLAGIAHRVPLWRMLLRRFTDPELGDALDALAAVGLRPQALQRASTLSGGQQQRAALARALAQGARVLLADEPVASLDPESARRVMELLAALNRDRGMTVVVSLHQVPLALRYCARSIALKSGAVVYDGPSAALTPALLRDLYGSEAAELFEDAPPATDVMPAGRMQLAMAG